MEQNVAGNNFSNLTELVKAYAEKEVDYIHIYTHTQKERWRE